MYILEDDVKLIGKNAKIIAIPIYQNVYSLVNKADYENNYGDVYYSLYARLYWKLKNRGSNISYENFIGIPERDMLEKISNLLKIKDNDEEEINDDEEVDEIFYVVED